MFNFSSVFRKDLLDGVSNTTFLVWDMAGKPEWPKYKQLNEAENWEEICAQEAWR